MEAAEQELAVGEFTVNFASAGNGPALLMLHGSEPQETWHVWEPLLPMADAYRLIAPDLLGHGKSSKPIERPDHKGQARMLRDLIDKIGVGDVRLIGGGWGGQIALEFALEWPESVVSMVLVATSYDKDQLRPLRKLEKPTLIVFAEDDMVTQLKAGYLLRDAIGVSRLEVLDAVSKDPRYDFRMSHRLQKFRAPQVLQLARLFLSNPQAMVTAPPELEKDLRGMELRKDDREPGSGPSVTP